MYSHWEKSNTYLSLSFTAIFLSFFLRLSFITILVWIYSVRWTAYWFPWLIFVLKHGGTTAWRTEYWIISSLDQAIESLRHSFDLDGVGTVPRFSGAVAVAFYVWKSPLATPFSRSFHFSPTRQSASLCWFVWWRSGNRGTWRNVENNRFSLKKPLNSRRWSSLRLIAKLNGNKSISNLWPVEQLGMVDYVSWLVHLKISLDISSTTHTLTTPLWTDFS